VKRDDGLPRSDGGLSRKGEGQPREDKADLEEIEAAVETGIEEMKVRMDVFEEMVDKIDTAGKPCLGNMEANIETGQGPRQAESKTDLEMDTMDLKAN
jgi:hypothetical protein